MDEKGNDQNTGVLNSPKELTREECLTWCGKQDMATGCEFKIDEKKCSAHTYSVSSASGDQGMLCSVIMPKGLFLISIKQIYF